jgi:hypothetical protein
MRVALFGTSSPPPPKDNDAELIDLAAMLEPDGGMPGKDLDRRLGRTIAAIFAFAAAGHSLGGGAFRLHLARLVEFLKGAGAPTTQSPLVHRALLAASAGNAPGGNWVALARNPDTRRERVEAALAKL